MSERGSFVTEFIYCEKCFEVVKQELFKTDYCEDLANSEITDNHIIAGRVQECGPQEELIFFEHTIIPNLEEKICHPVRIAVLAEQGEKIFTAEPNANDNRNNSR